jgi:hypothetical protein
MNSRDFVGMLQQIITDAAGLSGWQMACNSGKRRADPRADTGCEQAPKSLDTG